MTYLSCVGVEICRAGALLQRRSIECRVEKCESRIFHSFFASREEQNMVNLLDQLRKIYVFFYHHSVLYRLETLELEVPEF